MAIRKSTATFLSLTVLCSFACGPVSAADDILLRDLTSINNRTVVSFDADGVKLDNGQVLGWDAIETATVATNSEKFNEQLKQLSEPLYRVKQRLKIGDFGSLLETAESLYPIYKDRSSPTAYMVVQSVMWSRLESGKREAAVEPYLRAFDLLVSAKISPDLPGDRRLKFDSDTGLTEELLPIWFDAKAAKDAYKEVAQYARTMKARRRGLYAYAVSLAIAGGEQKSVASLLKAMDGGNEEITQLQAAFALQRDLTSDTDPNAALAKLLAMEPALQGAGKPVAWYWLGLAQTASKDPATHRSGMLFLLRLPALYSQQNPEVAAAGVYQAMVALRDADRLTDSILLRKQLLSQFGATMHAAKAKAD
ncbi:MAG: hypothetical protein NXI22_18955 [bacterium]|nr:hypothetical protein [bacterium]